MRQNKNLQNGGLLEPKPRDPQNPGEDPDYEE